MPKLFFFEFDKYRKLPFSKKEGKTFRAYLQEIWENRRAFSNYEDEASQSSQAFFKFEERHFKAQNYVGFLKYKDWDIHIFPKIFNIPKKPNPSLYYRHLIYYLSYCRKINFPFSLADLEHFESADFLEIWYFLFAGFCEKLLKEESYKSYQKKEEKLPYLKGRLDTNAYFRQNLKNGNWQNLNVLHEPFIYDNLFNRILKYTLRQMLKTVKNPITEEKFNELLFMLQDVSDKVYSYQDCLRVKLSALKTNHQSALEVCKVYLLNEQWNFEGGLSPGFAFLLPMEAVFEDFIFSFLQEHFYHLKPESQSSMYLAKTKAEGKPVFQIRNDIYLPEKNILIDAKYKLRGYPFADEKTGVAHEDIYQTLSYAIARNCQNVLLLYPASFKEKNLARKQNDFIIKNEFLGNKEIRFRAADIDISVSETKDMKTTLDNKIKKQLEKILAENPN